MLNCQKIVQKRFAVGQPLTTDAGRNMLGEDLGVRAAEQEKRDLRFDERVTSGFPLTTIPRTKYFKGLGLISLLQNLVSQLQGSLLVARQLLLSRDKRKLRKNPNKNKSEMKLRLVVN